MTANQIAFYKAAKEAEHYDRSDTEAQRHNFASESLSAQDLSIKDWANRENVRLGFANSAINQAHYERSDENAKIANQVKTDELLLNAINTLGEPVNSDYIGFTNYYTLHAEDEGNPDAYVRFKPKPLQYSYGTPQAIGNYGKALNGVNNSVRTVVDIVDSKD